MQIVQGIIKDNTVLVEECSLAPYEGERVTVMLPGPSSERNVRAEKRMRYFAEKARSRESTPRTVAEIDASIREHRDHDRL